MTNLDRLTPYLIDGEEAILTTDLGSSGTLVNRSAALIVTSSRVLVLTRVSWLLKLIGGGRSEVSELSYEGEGLSSVRYIAPSGVPFAFWFIVALGLLGGGLFLGGMDFDPVDFVPGVLGLLPLIAYRAQQPSRLLLLGRVAVPVSRKHVADAMELFGVIETARSNYHQALAAAMLARR
jgi:hypothetical protein